MNILIAGLMMIAAGSMLPTAVFANTPAQRAIAPRVAPLEISGWIPYWRTATGTIDALLHLDTFTEINPFGYTVKQDGSLFDAMDLTSPYWQVLMYTSRAKKIRVIPTVMWSNTEAIHRILKNKKLRAAHIKQIVQQVKEHNFDGIDIDYEAKKADTRPYFSAFLRELYSAIGNKWVMCTIESRTPLDSRFDTIPQNIEYANDYIAINKYCDRVRIMAYDQQAIDLRLNDAAPGPYVPVADPKWVEKVITLASRSIAKKKIVIGIPTYGYEYEVRPLSQEGYAYDLLWSFNPKYALDLAQTTGAIPQRNMAGELSFSYFASAIAPAFTATQSPQSIPTTTPAATPFSPPSSTPIFPHIFPPANQATATPFRIVWWSDAAAIKDKIDLARKLGVRGVAIFKIDGGEDPEMWNVLSSVAKKITW